MKTIGHIDADCFYVSCERVRDPFLKNKPVVVLGNQGACVIAKSYETKIFGITVGMPVWQAKKACPTLICVKRDFAWYEVISEAMRQVFRRYSDCVEYYSIDESFIDFGEYPKSWVTLAKTIQNEIMEEVGIPVSVGIGMTRIIAKIGSDKNKPFGVCIVTPKNITKFLKEVTIQEIPGIGSKLSEKLLMRKINTAFDYIKKPSPYIKKLLHKPGEEIWYELQGKSILPIRSIRPEHKVVSRGGSLWGRHGNQDYIWAFLLRHLERFMDALWKQEVEIKSIMIVLIAENGIPFKAIVPLPDYSNSYLDLMKALKSAFFHIFSPGTKYVMAHIVGTPIRSIYGKQMSILEKDTKSKKWTNLKQTLNKQFGLFTVRSGATAYAPDVFSDKAGDVEISDLEGKFCF